MPLTHLVQLAKSCHASFVQIWVWLVSPRAHWEWHEQKWRIKFYCFPSLYSNCSQTIESPIWICPLLSGWHARKLPYIQFPVMPFDRSNKYAYAFQCPTLDLKTSSSVAILHYSQWEHSFTNLHQIMHSHISEHSDLHDAPPDACRPRQRRCTPKVHLTNSHWSPSRTIELTIHSGLMSSWNDSLPFRNWTGVTCSRWHKERVTFLNIMDHQLVGSIPASIGNLTFLQYLYLSSYGTRGWIPPEVGHLYRLYLNLSYNTIEGEIPINLTSCSELLGMDLTGNKLTGKILVELESILFKLTSFQVPDNLKELYVGRNSF